MGDSYLTKALSTGGTIWNSLRLVRDNWQNVFTGLGTARDKTQYGRFVTLQEVPDTELRSLYHQNDTARRVVALKPQEMMRQGFRVNAEDAPELTGDVSSALRDLQAGQKIRDALIWGRLYGGCAVMLGADDGLPAEEPLNEDRVRSLKFLHVIDRRYLVPDLFFDDPMNDEKFGEPSHYLVVPRRGGVAFRVHRSRLLMFGGAHTDDEERDRLGGWDHSVLTPVYGVLRGFDSVWQAAEHLMVDASQGVFKIQGLMSMIAGGQKEELQTRMQLVDMSRSVARSLLLDADGGEDFSRIPTSFTDAHNMLDKFMLRLASAAEAPVTVLFGQSPAGMNATGESDFRWFYDTIRTAQRNELQPELERLVRVLLLAKDGPTRGAEPPEWTIDFSPLWQMTPHEQADLEKKHAEKDKLYVEAGVVLPEEIAKSRFRSDGWSPDTQIDVEARDMMASVERQPFEGEPVEEVEPEAEETETATSADLGFSPTDTATFTTVNEARLSKGLPAWPNAEEGAMTVAAFKALKESAGTKIGEAEGKVEAKEIDPTPDPVAPPAPFGASNPPSGAGGEGEESEDDLPIDVPSVPPESDDDEETVED